MKNIPLTATFPSGFTAGTPNMAYFTQITSHLAIFTINIRFASVTTLSDFVPFYTFSGVTPAALAGGTVGKLMSSNGSYIEISVYSGAVRIYSENVSAGWFYRGALPVILS